MRSSRPWQEASAALCEELPERLGAQNRIANYHDHSRTDDHGGAHDHIRTDDHGGARDHDASSVN